MIITLLKLNFVRGNDSCGWLLSQLAKKNHNRRSRSMYAVLGPGKNQSQQRLSSTIHIASTKVARTEMPQQKNHRSELYGPANVFAAQRQRGASDSLESTDIHYFKQEKYSLVHGSIHVLLHVDLHFLIYPSPIDFNDSCGSII